MLATRKPLIQYYCEAFENQANRQILCCIFIEMKLKISKVMLLCSSRGFLPTLMENSPVVQL